jgi:uncharacterized protein YwgA
LETVEGMKVQRARMIDKRIERIAEIIAYILQIMGGEIFSKTKLVKLLYLLDFEKAAKGESNYTQIRFNSYYYGPYSDDIEEAIFYLKDIGCVSVDHQISMSGNPYFHIRLIRLPDLGQITDIDRSEIYDHLRDYKSKSLNELLEITYNTEPYKETPFGEEIKF